MIYAYANMPPEIRGFWIILFILVGLANLIPIAGNIPALLQAIFQWSTTLEKPERQESIQDSNSIEMEVTKPVSKQLAINQKIQDQFKLEQEKQPSLNMIDFLKVHYPAIAEQWKEFEK